MQKRTQFTVKRSNGFAIASMLLMLSSGILRLVYYPSENLRGFDLWLYLWIPALSAAIYPLFLLLWGHKTLLPLCVPILGGVFFFIVKSFTFDSMLHTILCCLLYLTVLLLCFLTFAGILRTKLLLYPLAGLPLVVHLGMDLYDLLFAVPRLSFWDFLPELSVLCIIAALFCLVPAMKKG